ncbi:Bug family tripartite tricarboxylate transporter substrate binding protein [Ottowia thiooxydans]|uniref:Bug family tripartite tricarboxylate transporter substrate binding protein n=1 Tax=Ottowia thiooxydans TaxID=219182 RepID=UPI0003F882E9|nr:tripartite tricarboxylate transporter substrate binding protein [Ottowia thiooxydans]
MTRPLIRRAFTAVAAALSLVSFAAHAQTDQYPSKPIRLIVPVPPGGGSDAIARTVAHQMSQSMKTSIVVDNRPGAGGLIGSEAVAKASPDGYTLLMINNGFVINPSIYKVPFDPVKDFVPVTILASSPNLLVAHPSLPANNVKELIDLAKQKPGTIPVAISGGQMSHLAAALLEQAANIDLQLIPYKGAGVGNNDLVAGNVMLSFGTTPTYLAMIKAGKLKALGLGGTTPIDSLPNVPLINQTLPGFEANTWFGLFAPAGTPKAVVDRLRAEVVAALNAPAVQERMKNDGFVGGSGISTAQFSELIQKEMAKWSAVVKQRNINVN